MAMARTSCSLRGRCLGLYESWNVIGWGGAYGQWVGYMQDNAWVYVQVDMFEDVSLVRTRRQLEEYELRQFKT